MITRADLVARNYKHGHNRRGKETSEHRSWRAMIERCENPRHVGFKYYGAIGIKVCKRWRKSFATFLADKGLKPSPRHTIERIDPYGDYTPSNCRWSTPAEQRRNQRPYDEGARVQRSWDTGKRSRVSGQRLDLTGQRFSRLIVLRFAEKIDGRAHWFCQCDCGNKSIVAGKSLRSKATTSCGCWTRELSRQRAIIRNRTNNPAKARWK